MISWRNPRLPFSVRSDCDPWNPAANHGRPLLPSPGLSLPPIGDLPHVGKWRRAGFSSCSWRLPLRSPRWPDEDPTDDADGVFVVSRLRVRPLTGRVAGPIALRPPARRAWPLPWVRAGRSLAALLGRSAVHRPDGATRLRTDGLRPGCDGFFPLSFPRFPWERPVC